MQTPEPGAHAQNRDALTISAAVDLLASDDARRRKHARAALEAIGAPAVEPLLEALQMPDERVRHEALHALATIADPAAADAFVRALEDASAECRWAAAEGLVALRRAGLRRILRELERYPETEWRLRGAHHVLTGLRGVGYARTVSPVLHAFTSDIPEIELPKAAIHALTRLQG